MGEEQTPAVQQVDLGAEAVNQGTVSLPTTERLLGFCIRRCVDPTDNTVKWQSFEVATEHRRIQVEPGSVGDAQFNAFCDDVRAMLSTPAGQVVVNKMRALVRNRPLKVQAVLTESQT